MIAPLHDIPGRTGIKMCGFTTVEDSVAAWKAGVSAVGINLALDARHPLSVETAEQLASQIRAVAQGLKLVAVLGALSDHPPDLCERLSRVFDLFQITATDEVGTAVSGRPVLPLFFDGDDVEARVAAWTRRTGWPTDAPILLDSAAGGESGIPADFERAARIGRDRSLMLAGGLNATNVGAAIKTTACAWVDVATGVSAESPGRKCAERIQAFCQAARQGQAG